MTFLPICEKKDHFKDRGEKFSIFEKNMLKMLETFFPNATFFLTNESCNHSGHSGYTKTSHFRAIIISKSFIGIKKIERHRQVYQALKQALTTELHALSIIALTPQEAKSHEEVKNVLYSKK